MLRRVLIAIGSCRAFLHVLGSRLIANGNYSTDVRCKISPKSTQITAAFRPESHLVAIRQQLIFTAYSRWLTDDVTFISRLQFIDGMEGSDYRKMAEIRFN